MSLPERTSNFAISRSRDIDQIYWGNRIDILVEILQGGHVFISQLYSNEYRILSERNETNLSDDIIALLIESFGHPNTNRLLTDMRVYRTSEAGRILERSGGFISDIMYTLHTDGSACHQSYYDHLENDDVKYQVEFLNGVQDLPHYVLSRLYTNCNYLIDVAFAVITDIDGIEKIVTDIIYSQSFIQFLRESDIDDEHRNIIRDL